MNSFFFFLSELIVNRILIVFLIKLSIIKIMRNVLQDFLFVTDTGYGIILLSSDFYEGNSE